VIEIQPKQIGTFTFLGRSDLAYCIGWISIRPLMILEAILDAWRPDRGAHRTPRLAY
jgi:hypothetical protein